MVIKEDKRARSIVGVKIGRTFPLTLLLYIDDVFFFINGSDRDARKSKKILDMYGKAMGGILLWIKVFKNHPLASMDWRKLRNIGCWGSFLLEF